MAERITAAAAWRLRGPVGPAARRGLLHAVPVGAALLFDLRYESTVSGAVATAALLAGFVAFDAPARVRFRWQLAFAPVLGAMAALGALSSQSDPLAIATMVLVASAGGYLVAVSPRVAVAGMMLVLAVLLAQALDPGGGEATRMFLFGLAGGLLQALVALLAWFSSDRDREPPNPAHGPQGARRALRAELALDSHSFRHALRWGAALGAGVAAYRLTGFDDHGYWIPLTIIFVLKPEAGDTGERMAMRAAGTILGLALATALAEALAGQALAIAVALTLAAALSYALLAIEYALFTASITVFVVLLTDALGAPALQTADQRALATAAGIAIAAAAFYAWPNPGDRPAGRYSTTA